MVEYGHHAQNDRWAIEAVFPGYGAASSSKPAHAAGRKAARASCSNATSDGAASASSPWTGTSGT